MSSTMQVGPDSPMFPIVKEVNISAFYSFYYEPHEYSKIIGKLIMVKNKKNIANALIVNT